MSIGTFDAAEAIPAWKTVLDISELVPQDSWMLVGGLMTQVHAGLAGMRSRATDDVDMLVDVLAREATVLIPNLLGALVLKCAAYATDRRSPHRHLEDAALLASLITNHASVISQLHGSDRKRLRRAAEALSDPNEPSWLLLEPAQRIKGQDTMRILGA